MSHLQGRFADRDESVFQKAGQIVSWWSPCLDLAGPPQYGPPGLRGRATATISRFRFAGVESMADDARDKNGRKQSPTDEAALSARLRRLGERLEHTASNSPSEPASRRSGNDDASAMARGLRLATELVAGVVVGALIGWFLDRWLGISPWGFIVFLLLGFAAGLLNLMRSAGVLTERDRN